MLFSNKIIREDVNMKNKKLYKLEDIINIRNLYNSFYKCTPCKLHKKSVVAFNAYKNKRIHLIYEKFYSEDGYKINDLYHHILNERGKARLISSLTITDRLVQKAFNTYFLLPAFMPTLIYDNAASLKGRGTTFAHKRLRKHLCNMYDECCGNDFYYLKIDIKSYFDNIPHEYIYNLITKHTNDDRILLYFRALLNIYKEDEYIGYNDIDPNYGIGLGGEIPQTFGILCLNELDHMITEKFGYHKYIRYMDDIIILGKNKKDLENLLIEVDNYLKSISLEINYKKTKIAHIKESLIFLKTKYSIDENRKLYAKINKEKIKKFRRKLNKFRNLYINNKISIYDIYMSIQSTLSSYMIASTDGYAYRNKAINLFIEYFLKIDRDLLTNDQIDELYLFTNDYVREIDNHKLSVVF